MWPGPHHAPNGDYDESIGDDNDNYDDDDNDNYDEYVSV